MKPREGGDQLGAQWILDLWYFAPYGSPMFCDTAASAHLWWVMLICFLEARGKDRGSDILTTIAVERNGVLML